MKDKIEVVTDPARLRPIDADLQVTDCREFKEHTGWAYQWEARILFCNLLNTIFIIDKLFQD